MLTYLKLNGFKCFVDEKIDLAPLTLLSGLNSSGKSSIIQSLLLLKKQKPLTGCGPLQDFISVHSKKWSITAQDNNNYFSLSLDDKNYLKIHGKIDVLPKLFSFISAARLGPEPSLPLSTDQDLLDVGEKGEFVLDFLKRFNELKGLPALMCHNLSKSSSVRLNVPAWLHEISPGIDFEPYFDQMSDRGRAEYSTRRPTNVGFGISYTLPVIANVLIYAGLIASKNYSYDQALILIENPEAHLHPAGQTKIGEFLALAASCGVQCVVETHSDHLLNGIRIAVKNGHLSAKDTACHLFSYDFNDEIAQVQTPLLDNHGMFDEWPNGFFDESEKNLQRLL